MKPAPRTPYARASHSGKSSAAGLVLNFSPLEIDDKEVDAGVFAYGPNGDDVLKKLRKEHWKTHVFRRDGPDEIVAIAVTADAPKLGTKSRKIRLTENLGLTASLIRNALINYLAGLPRPVLHVHHPGQQNSTRCPELRRGMRRSQMMPRVCCEIDVGEQILQIGPVFGLGRLAMIK